MNTLEELVEEIAAYSAEERRQTFLRIHPETLLTLWNNQLEIQAGLRPLMAAKIVYNLRTLHGMTVVLDEQFTLGSHEFKAK
jgi:hypothetical protein